MTIRSARSGTLALALIAGGCGGAAQPAEQRSTTAQTTGEQERGSMAQHRGGMMRGGAVAMPDEDCPMMVPSVSVESTDVEGGAALTFVTTEADGVDELRARVRRMSERHHGATGVAVEPPPGRGAPMAMMRMPPAEATVVDVPGGARIELQALDTVDVDALREHVREHSEAMRAGACPMMGGTEETT